MDIDIVIPYVTLDDPVWFDTLAHACNQDHEEFSPERYRSFDTLMYWFRGVSKMMPWVRKIHLLVSSKSQVPDWLKKQKDCKGILEIHEHQDFIPEKFLPTFNSCTIEMFLHRIPNLSEHFIYFNDDIFAIRPMTPFDFFTDDGNPRLNISMVDYDRNDSNLFRRQIYNDCEVLGYYDSYTDKNVILKTNHSVNPMLRSICATVFDIYDRIIEERITKFRSDINLNQYIYPFYSAMLNDYGKSDLVSDYFSFEDGCEPICDAIKERQCDLLCINDSKVAQYYNRYKRLINEAFEDVFPKPCEFEKSTLWMR